MEDDHRSRRAALPTVLRLSHARQVLLLRTPSRALAPGHAADGQDAANGLATRPDWVLERAASRASGGAGGAHGGDGGEGSGGGAGGSGPVAHRGGGGAAEARSRPACTRGAWEKARRKRRAEEEGERRERGWRWW